MDHVPIHIRVKMPAVHLAGHHKIHLVGHYGKAGKIDGLITAPLREKYHMVKGVAVLLVNPAVILFKVLAQLFRQQVLLLVASADAADIVYRNGRFHYTAKVQWSEGPANDDSGYLWYFLPF